MVNPVPAAKATDNGYHLLVGQARFIYKLVIPNTGIGFLRFYNPMKNILAIFPLIQGKIIFAQFFR